MAKLTNFTKALIAIALTLTVAIISVSAYYFYLIQAPEGIELPDFTMQSRDDFLKWADENQVLSDQYEFSYEYSEDSEENTILSQSIDPSSLLMQDDILILTLSNGPDPDGTYEFPDFSDKTQKEIEEWFEKENFTKVTYSYTLCDDIDMDIFVKANFNAGDPIKRSDSIIITISSGNKKETEIPEVTVPDFSSYSKTNIQAWGNSNRITINITYQSSSSISKDKLISQSVKAGTKVKQGSVISIVLSSGKGITLSSLIGKSKSDAETYIRENALKAVYQTVYSKEAEGTVVSQNPQNGSVSEGTTITFQISAGLVPIEDYTGKTKNSFTSYIAEINTQNNGSAKINVNYTESESDKTVGTILSQSVSGKLEPGTTINVTVAIGKTITVVNKSGISEQDFRSYLSSLGLKPGNVSSAYSDTVASGILISNETGSYQVGSSVNFVVSKGAYVWDYSSLITAGNSYNALYNASSAARQYGYTVSKTEVQSDQYDKGIITENCAVSGKAIACKVSSGRVIAVPDVFGKSYTEAESILKAAGLGVIITDAGYSTDYEAGIVIAQNPVNTSVPSGSTVTISYSLGYKLMPTSEDIPLGILTGENEANIRATIGEIYRSYGFTNVQFIVTYNASTNSVQSIDPAPNGQKAIPSQQITVRMSQTTSN